MIINNTVNYCQQLTPQTDGDCVCVCVMWSWPVTQQDGMTLVAGSSVDGDSVQTFLTGPCPKHTNIYNTTTHSHTLLS